MKKSHRTWLAVPPEEKDEASQAHPRLDNGQNAIGWDKEHKLWYARPGVELDNFERWLPRPHDMSMNSDDPVTEFAQVLEDAGLVLKGLPVMDGSWQRVPTKNDKKGSKSGAYKGFLDGRPAGSYRDYRSADEKPVTWVYSGGNDMDPLARLHLRAHAQQTREDNARELAQQYNRQAGYATRYVSRLPQATTAPYLTRKGVDAVPGVRINPKGELVIPFSNAQGQIRSYQRIPETGGKDARILKDSEKTGNWFAMGTPVNGQPLLFAEGYATAASLHEASGLPVLMTIDAGNMIAVAQNARAVWPDSPFIFCADNDHQLKNPRTGEPENKGIISALKAAELTNGQIIVPAFTLDELNQKLTDFNDLDVSRGREVFHQEINVQLISAGVETPFSSEPHIHKALTRAGITSPSVQETIMQKEDVPENRPVPQAAPTEPAAGATPLNTGSDARDPLFIVAELKAHFVGLVRGTDSPASFSENILRLQQELNHVRETDQYTSVYVSEAQAAFDRLTSGTPAGMPEPGRVSSAMSTLSDISRTLQNNGYSDVTTFPSHLENLYIRLADGEMTRRQFESDVRMLRSELGRAERSGEFSPTDLRAVQDLFGRLDQVAAQHSMQGMSPAVTDRDIDQPVRDNAIAPVADNANQAVAPVPASAPAPAHDQEPQAARDYARYSNGELDAATLLQKVDADPAYKAALLSVLAQNAGDMQFNGQQIDVAAFAEDSLRGLASQAQADAVHALRAQVTQDYARYGNGELDAAALLQKVDTDPAYKAALLSVLAQNAGDMQFNGQKIDATAFAEASLQSLVSEARVDAAYARREAAPEAPGAAPEVPQPVSSELAHDQGQQASRDLSRFIRSEIDAATLLQNAEADPAYRAGLLAMFEQTGRDLQAQGHDIDIATYAEKTLRDLTGEIRMDEPVATSSPVASESVMPGQENSTEQPAITGQEAGLSREHPGDTPPASLQTQSVSDAGTSPQVKDDTVPVIDLSVLATNAGDDREPEMPFIDMSAFAKEKPDPTRPAAEEAQSQEHAATQSAERKEATDETTSPAEETDGIVYGPRRPDAPRREDLEQIIKGLTWEMLKNNTQIFRLDGEDAFRDLGNRLEMCSGASQDDRKVLAALVTAAKFYGGVIELTGSPEFKENAMRLIITHDLEIRMKLPAQRTQLEEMRKQMGTSQDAVVTHMPTPDLNRQTPTGEPAAAPQATATPEQPNPVPPSDVPPGPQPQVPPGPDASSPATGASATPPKPEPGDKSSPQVQSPATADAIKVQEMPVEPAPSALSPGQSVTAVLKNFGEAMYENKEQRGHSFFIELENRGGSHTYWGQDLRKLVEHHKAGDVVTLTLNSRDSWLVPGEEKERVKNDWSLVAAPTGIAVSHIRPEQGQQLLSFPVDTFGKLTQQIRMAWPDHMADLKLPPRFEDRLFYLGEDRHPLMAPQSAAGITSPGQSAPASLTPVMASMNNQSDQIDLLLIQSAGEHLQGVVRLNGTLYPALATPTADSSQLVINAITDQGPRFAGYGQAVNFEPDGTTRAAPQLMTFHLKGREEDTPLPARLYTPEKQDDSLFQRLGFEQTWKQWDDARKPEGRQEKALHQEHSHSPGR